MTNATHDVYLALIARGRQRHVAGLMLAEILRLAGLACILLLVLTSLDLLLSLPAGALSMLTAVMIALPAGALLIRLPACLRFRQTDYVRLIDRLTGSQRRETEAAWELAHRYGHQTASPLESYLVDTSIAKARARFDKTSFRQRMPVALWKQAGRRAGRQALLTLAAFAFFAPLRQTALPRIIYPDRDIPPFSLLEFKVVPDAPLVPYGSSAELSVTISGAAVRHPVYLETRRRGTTGRARCFQQDGTTYIQRLDQVIEPLEFCFRTGRARSHWHSLDLLLEPRVTGAGIELTPPAYSRLPVRHFPAGNRPLRALAGSRITLELTSNRPLSGGRLILRTPDGSRITEEYPISTIDPGRWRATWTATGPALVEAYLEDIRGERTRRPFRMQQHIQPDEPPRVVMYEPAVFSLATPLATVRISGYAEDDLGLRQTELVRTVPGFRDRALRMDPLLPLANMQIEHKLDLGTIGVEPGDVIELFIEATDHNPAMTGRTASEIARIQIISHDDYAAMLRERLRIEDFMRRYREAWNAYAGIAPAFDAVKAARDAGDDAAIAQALQQLSETIAAAGATMRRLADDFPAFAAEAESQQTFAATAKKLEDIGALVNQLSPGVFHFDSTLELASGRYRDIREELKVQIQQAETISAVARLIELANRYQRLTLEQERLVRRLARYPDPAGVRDEALFGYLSDRQSEVRGELRRMLDELARRAGELPDSHAALAEDAMQFIAMFEQAGIFEPMNQAQTAAGNRDGAQTLHYMQLALERLKQLLDQCEQQGEGDMFAGLCKNRKPGEGFECQTLEQMLQAWGIGRGTAAGAAGAGAGGFGDDGFFADGYSLANLPVYGPQRSQHADSGSGAGTGTGARSIPGLQERAGYTQPGTGQASSDTSAAPPVDMPEKYRRAIQKYFSE